MPVTLTIALSPRAQEALRRLAAQQGVTEAEAAASVLDTLPLADGGDGGPPYVLPDSDEPVQPGSVFERVAHLCGIIEDGPPDLSSNPRYLEGFGE